VWARRRGILPARPERTDVSGSRGDGTVHGILRLTKPEGRADTGQTVVAREAFASWARERTHHPPGERPRRPEAWSV